MLYHVLVRLSGNWLLQTFRNVLRQIEYGAGPLVTSSLSWPLRGLKSTVVFYWNMVLKLTKCCYMSLYS